MTGKIIYDNLNFTDYGPKGITTVHESVRIRYPFFWFARHGRALMGASPEHARVVGNV